ncbi:MauE/DoxX family redox-associated membrane protein [Paenibacillus dendritiformis]|uniref:MauE/DoxX family redox-associated membrane protein n=1 Tax=Paenibacillus dendritiformis TaxID=130049 RepID=UPI0018CEB775|nr:MauE/DoxX family redox-associated membrane protein [Paenibacillus dendritiformis]
MALVFMFQSLVAFLFLSTFLHKARNYRDHIRIMNAYQMVPTRFIVPSFIVFAAAELAIGLSTFLNGSTVYHAVSICSLLSIYTIAIGFNLMRGHRHIQCGCGGILENEQLHWGLVLRNLLLSCSVVLLWKFQSSYAGEIALLHKLELLMLSLILFSLLYLFKDLFQIKKKLVHLMKMLI